MIKSSIVGSNKVVEAEVVSDNFKARGLVTYNIDYNNYTFQSQRATSEVYGPSLAINAAFSGVPDLVHNGTDNVGWTATALSGTWDFSSTDFAADGTQSIDATGTQNDDTALFTRSTPLNTNDYIALTLSIYVDSFSDQGTKDIEVQFRLAGVPIGDTILLGDFVDFSNIGTWINVPIDLNENDINGDFDEIIITNVDIGDGPPIDFYLDEIYIQEFGETGIYTITTDTDADVAINSIEWVIADDVSTTVADGTMPGLSFDSILGVAGLNRPIVFRIIKNGRVIETTNLFNLGDILSYPNTRIDTAMCDGVNTFIKIVTVFRRPLQLSFSGGDAIEIRINNNLSDLTRFQVVSDLTISHPPNSIQPAIEV